MIPLLVFYVHCVAFATGYTRRWQSEGVSEGMLALFFMALIFFVGWSMTSFIVKLFLPAGGSGVIDRDSASLLLLTVAEAVFYYFYLKSDEPPREQDGVAPE
jgi:hypothetical protein